MASCIWLKSLQRLLSSVAVVVGALAGSRSDEVYCTPKISLLSKSGFLFRTMVRLFLRIDIGLLLDRSQ